MLSSSNRLRVLFARPSISGHYKLSSSSVKDVDSCNYRSTIAPWLKFGQYEKGLLSHLSTLEILRAMLVLKLCSWDVIVNKSAQLFSLSRKFGKGAEIIVRKTFYDQFVGGDEESRMSQVVSLLHRRGLTLMICPVIEEDVEDETASEVVYDNNVETFKSLAKMAASMDNQNPVVQLRVSAIIPTKTLETVSMVLCEYWNDSRKLADVTEQIAATSPDKWTFLSGVPKEDKDKFQNGVRRAHEFANLAKQLGVNILVDSEFYSCKLAISTLSLGLMAKYNGNGCVIGDTIQAYLKDAKRILDTELDVLGKKVGCLWYGKVVRGAYMDRERYLAKKKGVPSPICSSYEDTSTSYNLCVSTILDHITESKRGHLVVASHNEKSIRLAVQKLSDLGIPPSNQIVSFAQIYGMADYLSTPLVNSGYKVYKSTPYGPLAEVVPYLARRASENRSVMQGAREERIMLRKELLTRLYLQ